MEHRGEKHTKVEGGRLGKRNGTGGKRLRATGGECDQHTLYTHVKMSQGSHYFVQLIYAKGKKIFQRSIKKLTKKKKKKKRRKVKRAWQSYKARNKTWE
jgi:hypothetical protein